MSEQDGIAETGEMIRKKILFLLTVYPRLSRAMIQVGLGTAMPPSLWSPILEALIQEGKVGLTAESYVTPRNTNQTYQIYHLPNDD